MSNGNDEKNGDTLLVSLSTLLETTEKRAQTFDGEDLRYEELARAVRDAIEERRRELGIAKSSYANEVRIHRPPAHFLASIAKFILSKAAYQRYIQPHVEDIRLEHYEALQAGERQKARWIVVRGYCQALWPLLVAAWATITALRYWAQ